MRKQACDMWNYEGISLFRQTTVYSSFDWFSTLAAPNCNVSDWTIKKSYFPCFGRRNIDNATIWLLIYQTDDTCKIQVHYVQGSTPWMFLALDILIEYWIEHITPIGLLYVMFTFPTRIFYRSSRLYSWLSLWRLVLWINHLPAVC